MLLLASYRELLLLAQHVVWPGDSLENSPLVGLTMMPGKSDASEELVLEFKGAIAIFSQTMQSCRWPTRALDAMQSAEVDTRRFSKETDTSKLKWMAA